MTAFFLLLLALGNRLRGGLWGDRIRSLLGGGNFARIVWGTAGARQLAWGLPTGVLLYVTGFPLHGSILAAVMLGLSSGASQYGGLNMGRVPGQPTSLKQFTGAWEGMTHWGLAQGLPLAMILWYYGTYRWYNPILWGLLFPAYYEAIHHIPSKWLVVPGLGRGSDEDHRDRPEPAEAIAGAYLALCLLARG